MSDAGSDQPLEGDSHRSHLRVSAVASWPERSKSPRASVAEPKGRRLVCAISEPHDATAGAATTLPRIFGQSLTDSLCVPLRPSFARASPCVLLVERYEEPHELAPDRRASQQLRQLRQVDKPVGVPGCPVRVVPVDDPIHDVVRLARLMKEGGYLR